MVLLGRCILNVNDILEIALITDRRRYAIMYKASFIVLIFIIVFFIVIFTYKYQSYYLTMGTMIDNKLELLVNIKDIELIEKNNKISINNSIYDYKIAKVDDKLYRDDNYNNYKTIYLNVINLTNIDNYVYEVKIPKEYKTLANYLKDFLKEV